MKKRLMMVAVLIGALSLSACVDNKESDSVVAVRTAKANQLNSIAAMNNAEAEAQKAITAAEVALKEAEAAFRKAKAEAEQADADQKKILLQIAQAGLEAKLAAAKIGAEAELERAKAALETAKASLIAALDQVDQATKERISVLLGKADALLNAINVDRTNLIFEKNSLAQLKAGLITAELLNKKTIANEEKSKAVSKALIAEYEKYNKGNKEEAQKLADEAYAKYLALDKVFQDKQKEYILADGVVNTSGSTMAGSRYVNILSSNSYFASVEYVNREITFMNEDNTVGLSYSIGYVKYAPNVDRFNESITYQTRELAVKNLELSDARKELTKIKATESYKGLLKDVKDAQKKFDNAKNATEKENARRELMVAEQMLGNATFSVDQAIENLVMEIKNRTVQLDKLKADLAAVTGDEAKTYAALIVKHEQSIDAFAKAYIAMEKASHNRIIQYRLSSSLGNVALGLVDYADLIYAENVSIARADERIAAATTATQEQTIVNTEKRIAQIENNLSVNEPMYQDYLTQIKALVDATN